MRSIEPTSRTTLVRRANRGNYDRERIYSILDEALISHVGFVDDNQPFVIPTIHARIGDRLFVHGAVGNRMLAVMRSGAPICVTTTIVDGLVLARSAFHHSMNYRSVVLLGTASEVTDADEKRSVLGAIVEHVLAGRLAEVRAPSKVETRATAVLAVPIEEASAKIRSGGPIDTEQDLALSCWAGVVPLAVSLLAPIGDPALAAGTPLSPAVAALIGAHAGRRDQAR